MVTKRIFAILLAFALVLGGVPAGTFGSLLSPVVAEAATTGNGYILDPKTKTCQITTAAGWEALNGLCWPGWDGLPPAADAVGDGMAGWTVTLENDIALQTYDRVAYVNDFKGTFDGQGHVIKISGDMMYFSRNTTPEADLGLFNNLMGTAVVKNLIVWLDKGTLIGSEQQEETLTNYGAVVGRMSDSSQLLNCALVGGGTVQHHRRIGSHLTSGGVLSMGSMVGKMEGNSKIDGCYSEISVTCIGEVIQGGVYTKDVSLVAGGIVGWVMGDSPIISNTAYLGPRVAAENDPIGTNFVGGILGAGSSSKISITNCFVKGTQLYSLDRTGKYRDAAYMGPIYGGYIAISGTAALTNCASNARHNGNDRSYINTEGQNNNIDGVRAVTMGTAWADTMEGFPSLKWLVERAVAITVTAPGADGSSPAIKAEPSYVNYSGETAYGNKDALWKFVMTVPMKGRTAPMTANVSLRKVAGLGASFDYHVELPTTVPNTTYHYKLVATVDAATTEAAKTYTSTQDLSKVGYAGAKVEKIPMELNTAGTALANPYLLLVAVDNDIGTKMPSAVTYFDLAGTLPTADATPKVCVNPNAAGATNPTTGQLESPYSDKSGQPPTKALTWDELLPLLKVGGVASPKLSIDYIATGDIQVTMWPAKDRFQNPINSSTTPSRFASTSSGSGVKGAIAPKPVIYPRGNGTITGGVTISIPEGATVLYTATPDVLVPDPIEVDTATGKPKAGSTTKTYRAGQEIPFPPKASSFVVSAVAWMQGKSLSDMDYVLYKNDANLLTPGTPTLLISGIKYSSDSTYPDGSDLVFEHPDLLHGEVLFTVNGEEPVAGRYNTKRFLPSGAKKDDANVFDPSKPYKMASTSELVSIRAKFHDNDKMLDSPIANYLIAVKQKLSAPVASVANNTLVRPGASLELSLSDAALAQLNTNSQIPVERLTYQAGLDDLSKFPGIKSVTVAGDTPQPGVDYVSYRVNSSSQTYTLPIIRYRLGEDKTNLASGGTLYRYGQRRVLGTTKTVTDDKGAVKTETEVTITYINPQPISLAGTAGQQIKINTMAVSGMEVRSDSDVVTFSYTIRSAMAKPVAYPVTEPNKPTPINVGDRIALSSETSDALIFYTLDGSEPRVEYTPPTAPNTVGSWKPFDKNTMLYSEMESIKMASNTQLLFTVRAIAVSKNFSLENSLPTLFLYQPPAQVPAVFASPIQGAVVVNQGVTLQCAMEGARIFYKTFTSPPDITSPQGKLDNIPQPNRDQIFDPKTPIAITKPTWIVAVAESKGAISSPSVNMYTVASQLPDPTASLKTGSVVYKGTRIRLNANGNLAFTLDGSDPKTALAEQQAAAAAGKEPKGAVLYGDNVVLDAEYGKSVTVRAFAYSEGNSPSNTVSFTYTICEKDTYLTVSPAAETVVTEGDNITMTTGITNGTVYYAVGSRTPTLTNYYGESGSTGNGDYTHYQWRAANSTRKGNSVVVTGEPGGTFTLKATAVANGSEGGTVSVFNYRIRSRSSAPTASIPSGAVVFDGATVTLTAQEGDIFYTTDGTEPSTSSRLYQEPIKVTGSMVLKAIAVAKDKVPSNAVEYIYSYADQAFAPSMSLPSGEIEQGSRITLTSQTPDAVLYYTTNGVDPTPDSSLYSAPITIMRPVSIKAIAVRKDLRTSVVNTATYTVIEPEPPTLDDPNGAGKPQGPLDSLVSRRTYFDANAGPKFTDVVIQDPQTNAVLSANAGNVPKRAQLVVKQIDSSDSDRQAVRSAVGYDIVTLYDVSLEEDGVEIQPMGEVEIGIPIPSEYQNGIVTICRVGADNTVEEYKPRRSGNNAYITVEGNLDRYAITVPKTGGNATQGLAIWQMILLCVASVFVAGGGTLLVLRLFRKRRPVPNGPDDPKNFSGFGDLDSSHGFDDSDDLDDADDFDGFENFSKPGTLNNLNKPNNPDQSDD